MFEGETKTVDGRPVPGAKIETARENADSVNMSHMELRKYCQNLFRFKTIEVMRFKLVSILLFIKFRQGPYLSI